MAARLIFRGFDQVQRNLRRLAIESPDEFGRALYQETEVEATESKRRTPVDTGVLRASIHVEGPERSGRNISTRIVAGGPAAPYALQVHEDLEAFHPVGQAKFIESTLNESRPHMANRVARRIDLNKLVR